jgi:hypothetical protein
MMRPTNPFPVSSFPRSDERAEHDQLGDAVVLDKISVGSWRVCDSRVPANRAGYVLAFVEGRNGAFDVMQLTDDFRWHKFSSMRDAVAHVVDTNAALSARRRRGDTVWFD